MNQDNIQPAPAEDPVGAGGNSNVNPSFEPSVGQSPTPAPEPVQPSDPQLISPSPSPSPAPPPIIPTQPSIMPVQTAEPTVLSSTDNLASPSPSALPQAPQTPGGEANSVLIGNMGGNAGPSILPSTPSSGPLKPAGRHFAKALLIIVGILLVLAGGSAAAYTRIILPNKPQNVLKSAIVNSLQQTQVSFNGNVQAQSSGTAVKLTFNGASNTVSKDTDVKMNLTISGISFPVEVRLVDNNLYFKLGDVSSIVSVLSSISPEDGTLANSLASQLSNQWFVVDSTLIDESSEAKCAINTNLQLSKTDIQQLESLYSKNEFATIQSTSSTVLNGAKVEKINVSINNAKVENFAQSLSGFSLVKQLGQCSSTTNSTLNNVAKVKGSTNISVWVNKATKQIVQIGGSSNPSSSDSYIYLVGFSYGPVSVSAPANAKPVADLITTLEKSLGSSSL